MLEPMGIALPFRGYLSGEVEREKKNRSKRGKETAKATDGEFQRDNAP